MKQTSISSTSSMPSSTRASHSPIPSVKTRPRASLPHRLRPATKTLTCLTSKSTSLCTTTAPLRCPHRPRGRECFQSAFLLASHVRLSHTHRSPRLLQPYYHPTSRKPDFLRGIVLCSLFGHPLGTLLLLQDAPTLVVCLVPAVSLLLYPLRSSRMSHPSHLMGENACHTCIILLSFACFQYARPYAIYNHIFRNLLHDSTRARLDLDSVCLAVMWPRYGWLEVPSDSANKRRAANTCRCHRRFSHSAAPRVYHCRCRPAHRG